MRRLVSYTQPNDAVTGSDRSTPTPATSRFSAISRTAASESVSVACHTPRNALGALDWSRAFTGSPGGTGGRAPAITAEALVEEGYDEETLAQTLLDGFTPGFDVLGGPMGEVILDSTSQWSEEDRAAVAEFLLAQ